MKIAFHGAISTVTGLRSGFPGLFLLPLLLAFAPAARADLNCPALRLAVPSGETTPAAHARGLLWRIAKPGLPPSYLFGTIHLGDEALVNLPAPVADALDRSRRFVMEARLDGEDMLNWSQTLISDDESALRVQLGAAVFDRAMALLPRYGLPEAAGARLKPWALYLTLSTPPQMGGMPLDLVLAMRAEKAGKGVDGLETVAEQATVVAGLPLEDQVDLVRDAVCHYEALQGDIQSMKQLYLDRNLAALAAMANRYEMSESPRYQHLLQQVLWERNDKMVSRMQPYLAEGGAFIAVGALHLPGARGLLGLLETRGYRVDVVY
jgi:uncharacterized protein YbaP (TraB family)